MSCNYYEFWKAYMYTYVVLLNIFIYRFHVCEGNRHYKGRMIQVISSLNHSALLHFALDNLLV